MMAIAGLLLVVGDDIGAKIVVLTKISLPTKNSNLGGQWQLKSRRGSELYPISSTNFLIPG